MKGRGCRVQKDFLLVTSELVHGQRMGALDPFPRVVPFPYSRGMPYLHPISRESRKELEVRGGLSCDLET